MLRKLPLTLYDLLWRAALPILRRRPRLVRGWRQRTLAEMASGPFDLWIQAASGGESRLTNTIVAQLAESVSPSPDRRLQLLLTTGTDEGLDLLRQGQAELASHSPLDLTIAFFPFDAPHLMRRALKNFAPRLILTLETELWPGLLVAARENQVPLYLINGRMSAKSFRSYRRLSGFFHRYGPQRVWAVSPADGRRFAEVVGAARVALMDNIKFDRLAPGCSPEVEPGLGHLLSSPSPLVIFGSIRREEEEKILTSIGRLLTLRPDLRIAIFPKHLARAEAWLKRLRGRGIVATLRSQTTTVCPAGSVVVWDLFGELAGAYTLASAAFVGGSLVDGGGQNFLEPLAAGLRPIIGPHWESFAWVGQEIIDCGLVLQVANEEELAARLLQLLASGDSRQEVKLRAEHFFARRRGGTRLICHQILTTLQGLPDILSAAGDRGRDEN
jgi:3-deoxy-D-manno-octulosonic-acid transferase